MDREKNEVQAGQDTESLLFPKYTKEIHNPTAIEKEKKFEYIEPDLVGKNIGEKQRNQKKTAVIIGAGIAGLGIACLLAKKGYAVSMFEKNSEEKSKLNQKTVNGYTFTNGPSWLVMPQAFEYFFSLLGEDSNKHIPMQRITPAFTAYVKDSSLSVDVRGDWIVDGKFFESIEPGAELQYEAFIKDVENNYDFIWNTVLFDTTDPTPFARLESLLSSTLRTVFGTSASYVRAFFKHDVIQKVLQYQHVVLGGSPYASPALTTIMANLEKGGAFYPEGGMVAIERAFRTLSSQYGVTCTYSDAVSHIRVEKGIAIGVELESGRYVEADLVISNADMAYTETSLLAKEFQTYNEQFWKEKTMAPSAFVMHLGLKKQLVTRSLHTILFPKDWKHTHTQLFSTHQFPDDPIVYIHAPSHAGMTVAPSGKDAITVTVPIPAGITFTEQTAHLYREQIIRVLAGDMGMPDIESLIETEIIYSSKQYIEDYNNHQGTAYGIADATSKSGVRRMEGQSKKVANLFYVGEYTQPGNGLSFSLLSAVRLFKIIHSIKNKAPLDSSQIWL